MALSTTVVSSSLHGINLEAELILLASLSASCMSARQANVCNLTSSWCRSIARTMRTCASAATSATLMLTTSRARLPLLMPDARSRASGCARGGSGAPPPRTPRPGGAGRGGCRGRPRARAHFAGAAPPREIARIDGGGSGRSARRRRCARGGRGARALPVLHRVDADPSADGTCVASRLSFFLSFREQLVSWGTDGSEADALVLG